MKRRKLSWKSTCWRSTRTIGISPPTTEPSSRKVHQAMMTSSGSVLLWLNWAFTQIPACRVDLFAPNLVKLGEKREQRENTVSQGEFRKKSGKESNKREIICKLKGGHKQPRQERVTAVGFVEGEIPSFMTPQLCCFQRGEMLLPAHNTVLSLF